MGFNNVGEIIFNPGKFSVAERAKAIQTTMCLMEVTVNQQIEECLKLAVKSLMKIIGDEFNVDRIDSSYILKNTKKVSKFPKEKIEKVVKELKKK